MEEIFKKAEPNWSRIWLSGEAGGTMGLEPTTYAVVIAM